MFVDNSAINSDIMRNIRNGHFEITEDGGLFLPKEQAEAAGWYKTKVNDGDWVWDKNILPTEGRNNMLDVYINDGTKLFPWYVALFQGNYTPVAGLTAASFTATAGEITSITEGYTGANRIVYTPAAAASGVMTNSASGAQFTIVTASSLVVRGAAMLSEQVRGATTGTILSAARFANDRTLYNTDVFTVVYQISLTSS